MKKIVTILCFTLLSTSLINGMHLLNNKNPTSFYVHTEPPRRTANGWILKNDTEDFTEYCILSDSDTLASTSIYIKKSTHYGFIQYNKLPEEYRKPRIIFVPKPTDTQISLSFQAYLKRLFLLKEQEYNQATQLPIVEENGKDMLYEYIHGKTVATPLGFITNKLTKLYSVKNFNPNVVSFIAHYALTDEHGVPLNKEFHIHTTAGDNKYCESHFDRESEELKLIGSNTDTIKKQFEMLQDAYENT